MHVLVEKSEIAQSRLNGSDRVLSVARLVPASDELDSPATTDPSRDARYRYATEV